ncbi:MAG TPA: PqqD family protein [Candidatus Aquilonibacter sp.]
MNSPDARSELEAMPKCVPGLEIRPAGGEQLVHDPVTGRIHVLNAMAGRVLTRCDGTTTLAQIVAEIVASTSAEAARVERDIVSVCADFREKGLIS